MPDSFGSLIIRAFAASQAIPVEHALVEVFSSGASPVRLDSSQTGPSGQTDRFVLPAPPLQFSDSPDDPSAFQTYTVSVSHPDYDNVQIQGVSIFPCITSILPVQLNPTLPDSPRQTESIAITTGIEGAGDDRG